MQTVLLTGATGFVGRHLLHDLQQHDFNIVLPVRPDWQNRIDINPKQTRVVETNDLFAETSDWWCTALKHVDMVIHSAWCAEPGIYLTSPKNLDCLSGTMQLAKAAAQTDVKRFVGLGTCIEYEMSDASTHHCSQRHPIQPPKSPPSSRCKNGSHTQISLSSGAVYSIFTAQANIPIACSPPSTRLCKQGNPLTSLAALKSVISSPWKLPPNRSSKARSAKLLGQLTSAQAQDARLRNSLNPSPINTTAVIS
jgi:hypothetical protein